LLNVRIDVSPASICLIPILLRRWSLILLAVVTGIASVKV
jgi:hypothetical protein